MQGNIKENTISKHLIMTKLQRDTKRFSNSLKFQMKIKGMLNIFCTDCNFFGKGCGKKNWESSPISVLIHGNSEELTNSRINKTVEPLLKGKILCCGNFKFKNE